MNIFKKSKGNRFVEGLLLEADLATLAEVLSTNLTQIQIQARTNTNRNLTQMQIQIQSKYKSKYNILLDPPVHLLSYLGHLQLSPQHLVLLLLKSRLGLLKS